MTTLAYYPLRTVADFAAIPADRIDACLADFASWLRVSRKSQAIGDAATKALGGTVTFDSGGFTWVDDGIVGIQQVDIQCDGETIATWQIGKP